MSATWSELEPDVADADPGATMPKPSPVGRLGARRVALGSLGVVATAVGLVLIVRWLPQRGGAVEVVAVAIGLAIVPLVASVLEWFVHRFVYHAAVLRPLAAIFVVHTAHHYAFFPTWRYVTGGPARRLAIRTRTPEAHVGRGRNAAVRLAHFGWYMAIGLVTIWVPGWLVTHDVAFVLAAIVSTAVVSNLFIVVHDTIHRPGSHRVVEAQPWFAFLDRHHYIHHVALGANLNFLLPLADALFGTLRTELTADELARHGTLAAAKQRTIGEGERAKVAIAG